MQISRLTEIILERDTKEDYKYFRVASEDDPTRPTLLHLAAEQNFLHVSKALVEHYPGLMYTYNKKQEEKPSCLPVELALKKYKDDTAAYLISQMRHDRCVLCHHPLGLYLMAMHLSLHVYVAGHFVS